MKNTVKITLNPAYENLRGWVEKLPTHFEREGDTIYHKRNHIKVIELPDGTRLNVKRYCTPILINRFIYSTLRRPKAQRAYENALILAQKGISTPEPIAYMLHFKHGLLCESYLITKQLDLAHTFYEFGHGGIAGREKILADFVHFTCELHEKGVYHKDYSPGNILFDTQNGTTVFALVDINRVTYKKISVKEGCRNFARLWGNTDFFEFIAKHYAAERHADADFCRKEIFAARQKFWAGKHITYEYD